MTSPTPEKIRAAREAVGLTQTQAATLVHSGLRAWQKWESGERRMDGAHWELFCIKIGIPEPRIQGGGDSRSAS